MNSLLVFGNQHQKVQLVWLLLMYMLRQAGAYTVLIIEVKIFPMRPQEGPLRFSPYTPLIITLVHSLMLPTRTHGKLHHVFCGYSTNCQRLRDARSQQ